MTTNFVNVGITDNISIGGGFEFISTVVVNEPIWVLTPKAGFKISEKLHAGGGVLMTGISNLGTATLGYGVVTYGTSESNITGGAGYGYSDGELTDRPTFMIAGTHRVSKSVSLLTENYIIPVDDNRFETFGIHGIRIMGKKSAFDIGAIVIPDIVSEIPALPFVGYARVF